MVGPLFAVMLEFETKRDEKSAIWKICSLMLLILKMPKKIYWQA
jgi:hypothetical protein